MIDNEKLVGLIDQKWLEWRCQTKWAGGVRGTGWNTGCLNWGFGGALTGDDKTKDCGKPN